MQQQGPKASITIRTPDGKSLLVELTKPSYALGRSSQTELCYADDSGLSRQHLSIDQLAAISIGSVDHLFLPKIAKDTLKKRFSAEIKTLLEAAKA